jgi:hypothetical protein
MATWIEDNASRSATIYRLGKKATSTMTRSYKVFGHASDVTLHADCNQRISSTLRFWQYPGANVQLQAEAYSVDYLGDDAWHVEIQYEKVGADAQEADPMRRSRSFDTSGGMSHITQALDNVTVTTSKTGQTTVTSPGERIYGLQGQSPPSFKGAIGVDESGVNGVDIVVPALTWTETYDVPSTYITSGYIRGIAGLSGSVNNGGFRGFAAGEVLFAGASGSQEWDSDKGDGPWNLSFKFVASPNVTSQKIGDITGVEKKGHEYLWVRYESSVSSSELIKKPKAVYVNKVYRDGDFSGLGIGTT